MIQAKPEFITVTETPDTRASSEQLSILYTRYHLARRLSAGRDVLEAACGAGVGLGLIASVARSTTAGDIDTGNCAVARLTYAQRPAIHIHCLDAQSLPFPDTSFDTVIFLEAIYYIPSPDAFLGEASRVLRRSGTLLISSVNCEWSGFNPSPFSIRYFSAPDLALLLQQHGFYSELWAAFPESDHGATAGILRATRRAAVRLHLIPKTMKGKELLKRLVFGPLLPIPRELPIDAAPLGTLIRIEDASTAAQFKFIYAIATKE